MKPLLVMLFLALPAFAVTDAEIAALYEAWTAKHQQEITENLNRPPSDKLCFKGGKYENGERTDPAYLAWKDLNRRIKLWDLFTGNRWSDLQEVWMTLSPKPECRLSDGDRDDISQWGKKNLRKYDGEYPKQWPPQEKWESKGNVDTAGRATDAKGHVTTNAYGPNYMKYFWTPLILGLVFSLYAASKGGPTTLTFFGTVGIYAWLTDPMEVLGCFFAVYVVVLLLIVMFVKVALKGLGVGK